MSSWLDLDRSDDESLSSSDEQDGIGNLTDQMKNLNTNIDATPTTNNKTSDMHETGSKYTMKASKSMTLPTSFRPLRPSPNQQEQQRNNQYQRHHQQQQQQQKQHQSPPQSHAQPQRMSPLQRARPHRPHKGRHHHHRSPGQRGLKPSSGHSKQQQQQKDNKNNELKRTYSYPLPDVEPFCVWLGNLPAEAKPSDIVSYLEPLQVQPRDIRFGRIHKNKYTCAYVDFYNKLDMQAALQSIDCSAAPLFMGRQVEIDINEGIVVDREAAVTCTSSSSALNSPFRPQKNAPNNSKQDVRYSAADAKKKAKQKELKYAADDVEHNEYYAQRHHHNTYQRRTRGKGPGGKRNRSYFRGQYGHYRQKNGREHHAASTPSFGSYSASKLMQKPIKILQRPKNKQQNANANEVQNDAANKSRFPTLAEDHKPGAKEEADSSANPQQNNDYINYYYNRQNEGYKSKRDRHRSNRRGDNAHSDYYSNAYNKRDSYNSYNPKRKRHSNYGY